MSSANPDRALMDTADVAAFLHVPESTLRWWRAAGRGPAFIKVERAVRYRQEDLDTWLEQGTRQPGR